MNDESMVLPDNDDLYVKYLENSLHDIKSPIMIVKENVANAFAKIRSRHKLYGFLEAADKQIKKIYDALHDTNEFSRIIQKTYEPVYERADIVEFLKELLKEAKVILDKKQTKLTFNTNVDSKYIGFDRRAVERIMLNIITNAVKFSDMNGNVSVELNCFNGMINICVCDDGCGFPQKMIEYGIHRYDTMRKYNQNGFGIGLDIVKDLLDKLGGAVELGRSAQGGASILVMLPEVPHESIVSIDDEYYGVQLQLM